MDRSIRILGIDPGTIHVGYGVVEQRGNALSWIASGCIAAGGGDVPERLVVIYRGLGDIMKTYSPHEAAVEKVFTGNNPKTAIAIGEGRGVAVLAAAERGLVVEGYDPTMVKRTVTGNGRAGKEQVRHMVGVLLALARQPETDHESDALAIAITHARHYGMKKLANSGRGVSTLIKRPRRMLPEAVLRQLSPGAGAGSGRR